MKLSMLVEFFMGLIIQQDVEGETANPNIMAKLLWRDKDGCVQKVKWAEMGYGSPSGRYITIEMNTAGGFDNGQ